MVLEAGTADRKESLLHVGIMHDIIVVGRRGNTADAKRRTRMDYNEVSRASRNIDVIAGYLHQHFGDCTVQVVEQPPIFVRFLLSNAVTGERFVLGVFWPALGDRNNTPERIANKMENEDLARNLRIAKEYIWDHNAKPMLI